MVFGINSLLVLVIVRHSDTPAVAGLGLGTAVVFVAAAGGGDAFLANVLTPTGGAALGPVHHRQRGAAGGAALIQLAGATLQLSGDGGVQVAGSGPHGQVVKLCADTAMQIDVDDALRGHVFAVQDSVFWLSFIAATTVSAAVMPPNGHSTVLDAGRFADLPGRAGDCTAVVGRRRAMSL